MQQLLFCCKSPAGTNVPARNGIIRMTRPGMGLCQGKTCGHHVRGILARELGLSPAEIEECTPRSPNRPQEMYVLGNEADLYE